MKMELSNILHVRGTWMPLLIVTKIDRVLVIALSLPILWWIELALD